MTADQDRVEELLADWEERHERGLLVTAGELCRDCPELLEQVRDGIEALVFMRRRFDPSGDGEPDGPAAHDRCADTETPPAGLGAEPIPGYRLLERLGRGGFSEVWKAVGPGGVKVALKFIPLAGGSGTGEVRSLQFIKDVRHANLLPLFGTWAVGGHLILAIELADQTLADRLRKAAGQGQRGIPFGELIGYLQDAARGIDYLNEPRHPWGDEERCGIQHRDVKPQNLLLVGGSVKVADFGLARVLEGASTGHTGSMTPAYAAPEFFRGETSGQSDQYSLAVSYCQLRGGRLPFAGNLAEVMAGHLYGEPDLSMLPATERPVVARALAKEPRNRWPSCGEFVRALQACGADAAVPAARSKAIPARRPRLPLAVVAGCLALSVAILVAAVPLGLLVWLHALPGEGKGRQDADRPIVHGGGKPPVKIVQPPLRAGEEVNSIGMRLVRIPAGSFWMGAPAGDPDGQSNETQHEVEITRPFLMGVFEVTQGEYQEVMGVNPSHFAKTGGRSEKVNGLDTTRFPVESVSWEQACEFCRKLSARPAERQAGRVYRLPAEAEWEYACRDGERRLTPPPYHFGSVLSMKSANFNQPVGRTAEVGGYPANGFGLHDVHGNVWEWCQDWYGPYNVGQRRDPTGPPTGEKRVFRGGSWRHTAVYCRSAFRNLGDAGEPGDNMGGFRVACDTP